jgi:hypothetical protein
MGQANGLWLWQSDVGGMIVDAILDPPADVTDLLESPALRCFEHTDVAQELEI